MRAIALVSLCALSFISCQRESRQVRPEPARVAVYGDAARQSDLQPGGVLPQRQVPNPFHGAAYHINEGGRLFNWYNCSGCHANGAGGIGPPLIKQQWIYGGEPANVFDTIVKGRPNGMPSWGGRIPEYQIWQIVAFVESLNQKQPQSTISPRQDTLEQSPENIKNKVQGETR